MREKEGGEERSGEGMRGEGGEIMRIRMAFRSFLRNHFIKCVGMSVHHTSVLHSGVFYLHVL